MSRRSWLIEHASLGAYLGEAIHPSNGTTVPLFRAKDNARRVMLFPSKLAAQCEIARLDYPPATLDIVTIDT
jgi:hypothetical protein